MSYEPEFPPPGLNPAAERVNAPGILLMVVAILNLVVAALLILRGLQLKDQTVEEFKQQIEQARKVLPQLIPEWGQPGAPDPADMKNQSTTLSFSLAGVIFVAALLTFFGGVRMRAFQSYGLAIAGSVLALLPCISPTACCGLGVAAGIWSLVVLASDQVRAAFRAPPG